MLRRPFRCHFVPDTSGAISPLHFTSSPVEDTPSTCKILFVVCGMLEGRTCVAVLHDIAQAARYADHLVVMKDGAIVAQGAPAEVVTAELVAEVYEIAVEIHPDPVSGTPVPYPCRPRSGALAAAG